jgi:DNA mismatch endonuclease, patch repair protein
MLSERSTSRGSELISAKRSALMARIKGKNTKPEMAVRSAVHRLGYRFRLHRRDLPGSPDLVLPGPRKIIFVHGCFWHRHPGCGRTTTPKSRTSYWQEKFKTNRSRDRNVLSTLAKDGWDCLVIWECETFDDKTLRRRLNAFLRSS